MPLYNYVCRDCGHAFTDLVFGGEEPACPKCASARAEKQMSTFSVHGDKRSAQPEPGACGECGDPRGPGACAFDD